MPKYQSEFPQYVLPDSDENNFIEVEADHSTRLKQLQEKNERLRQDLAIFSRRADNLRIENAKLLEQNRQLKKRWLTEICIAISALCCLAWIIHVWN